MPSNQVLRDSPPAVAALLHATFLALSLALGSGAANLTAHGGQVSLWWPASGLNVLAVLALSRRRRVVGLVDVALVMTLANMLGGRTPALSATHGMANAVEAALVVLVLTRRRRHVSLVRLRDLVRLMLGAFAGAALGAVISGVALLVATGEPALHAVLTITISHASAVVVILPVVIGGTHPAADPARWARVSQAVLLVAVVLLVFWPDHDEPLTFLPMPFLVWATFLYSTRQVAAQLLGVAVAVTTLTTLGGGPFAAATQAQATAAVPTMQIFLLTYAVSVLAFATAQEERRNLRDRLAEREQMLQGGIVDAQFGLVIMNEVRPGVVQIVQSNRRAARLLAPEVPFVPRTPDVDELDDDQLPLLVVASDVSARTPFANAIDAVRTAPRGEVYDEFDVEGGRHVELHLTRVTRGNGGAVLTAQVMDVTQQRRADAAIMRALQDERAAAEHLRDLNRQKDDFVSTVSHELRTPITSIVGFVELVLDDTDPTREQRRYLSVVERNAHRLGALVEDLLSLGAGAHQHTVPAPTDLRALCTDVVEELAPYAQDHGVHLQLTDGPSVPCVVRVSDISRVVTNLVTNAIKFTPSGGLVVLQPFLRRDEAVLTVTDTGVGIAREDLERVFDRFYRSPRATERGVPGAGLGLALVRNLVTRNGGSVELLSNGTSGTQAVVRLPASHVLAAGERSDEPSPRTPRTPRSPRTPRTAQSPQAPAPTPTSPPSP